LSYERAGQVGGVTGKGFNDLRYPKCISGAGFNDLPRARWQPAILRVEAIETSRQTSELSSKP
jgi:hypothetical protein